jgi:quercetin dioxygenase-like cupin family protein
MTGLETTNLVELGRSLPVDTDHMLYDIAKGKMLLINLRPQNYPFEVHSGVETIIALSGSFTIESAGEQRLVQQGERIAIPANLEHRFGESSDAVILVLFSQ